MALVIHRVKLFKQIYELSYDLTVSEGTLLAVLGARHSGRSSLLHLIAGFEFPDYGEIAFQGVPIHTLTPSERPFSIVFRDGNLFNHLTLFENASLGVKGTLQIDRSEREMVKEVLAYVGLEGNFFKRPEEVDAIQHQRAAIARSILSRKPLLLLDEPFGALSSPERETMCLLLQDIHERLDLTTLFVVSDAQESLIAPRTAVIDQGSILCVEDTSIILNTPQLSKHHPNAKPEGKPGGPALRLAC